MDFSVILAASATVNRFVAFVKPYIRSLKFSTDVQDGLLILVQVLAGILIALMGSLNLFVGIPTLPPFAAYLLTGAVVGLGADVINVVIDLLYGWKNNVANPVAAVESTGDVKATATVEVG